MKSRNRQWYSIATGALFLLNGGLPLVVIADSIATPFLETDRQRTYYPGTETLASDEMRVIALGTGTPHIRPSQASAGWLVELGNGEKFIFDLGTGAIRNLSSLGIGYDDVNRVFISHLHMDHVADIDALWASGWTGGRVKPLEVWGPSGRVAEQGTRHYIENLKKAYAWDHTTRSGKLPISGGELVSHEFAYDKEQVVYENNGVKISSYPQTHILDGAVGYRLEWRGLAFVYSGDTTPNKWFVKNGRDADLLIHEVYMTVDQLMTGFGWSEQVANVIASTVHTQPEDAGKIFAMLKPRMAVAYHLYNDFDTVPAIEEELRVNYDGPLVFAQDLMTFNITVKEIRVRLAARPDIVWPTVGNKKEFDSGERAEVEPMSDWLLEGRLFQDAGAED